MTKQIVRMPATALRQHPDQATLDLEVDRQIETDGIGMGVLRDGTPFLNQRGLARLCGVENRYIGLISAEWSNENPSERTVAVRRLLARNGPLPAVAAHETHFGQKRVLAYPDTVCMAALEYYAFEAGLSGKEKALENYRKLASYGLRQFIYQQTGYSTEDRADLWKIFKDRVQLTYDAVPVGYFGVFSELSSVIVTLGLKGLHIDSKFVPDISVGQAWANHWRDSGLADKFGERKTYAHNYPRYFPQAASNPQLVACYPEDALGEFRRWVRYEYIGEGKFRKYLSKKVSERLLPEGYVESAMLALTNGAKF